MEEYGTIAGKYCSATVLIKPRIVKAESFDQAIVLLSAVSNLRSESYFSPLAYPVSLLPDAYAVCSRAFCLLSGRASASSRIFCGLSVVDYLHHTLCTDIPPLIHAAITEHIEHALLQHVDCQAAQFRIFHSTTRARRYASTLQASFHVPSSKPF